MDDNNVPWARIAAVAAGTGAAVGLIICIILRLTVGV